MSSRSETEERQNQKAEKFFQYGNEAALKGNFPYAIDMYANACKIAPEAINYRQAMRGVQRRRLGNNPAKVGMFASAKLQPIRLRIRAARAKGDWGHLLEVCEEAFYHNPWDISTANEAAEAALNLDLGELAQWLMESVQPQVGNDPHYWRHLARIHEHNKNWQNAINCWERVKKLAPSDEDAHRQINALSASATIDRSGMTKAIERSENQGDEQSSNVELPDEAQNLRKQTITPEQRLEEAIQEQPDRAGTYLELSDHYKSQERLDTAREVLARGLKARPDDQVLKDAYAEVQMARLRKAIDAWKRKLRENPGDAEARTKHKQLIAKLSEFELVEFRRRVADRPEDLQLRFELGVRLAAAGQHDQAIAEFQQARNWPALKVKSLLHAGQSFEANGVLKLAERSYQEALKAVEADDQETLNDLHYRLGRVAESLGNNEAAEEHYNEVAANNYGYLDVAERLRSLNQ